MATSTSTPSSRSRRIIAVVAIGLIVAVALTVFLIWLVFFCTSAPPVPSIENAAGILWATPVPG